MYAEGISIAVCVISKMYQNNNLRSFLNSLRVPVVVFEEKNSFGALEQTVLRLLLINYHFKIQSNEHMPLVPSSSYMESEMLPDYNHLQKCLLSVMDEIFKIQQVSPNDDELKIVRYIENSQYIEEGALIFEVEGQKATFEIRRSFGLLLYLI